MGNAEMKIMQLTDFIQSISDEFHLGHPAGKKVLRLKEAKALREGNASPEDQTRGRPGGPFALLFEGGLDETFEQGAYKIEHSALGAFDIFLVPIGQSDTGMTYEAIFN